MSCASFLFIRRFVFFPRHSYKGERDDAPTERERERDTSMQLETMKSKFGIKEDNYMETRDKGFKEKD